MSEVIITLGTGGVGKTHASLMLALHHAALGKKVLVITIDPARRLLDALGLPGHASTPMHIKALGNLHVLMPDLKAEWLDFLSSALGKSQKIDEIRSNTFYNYIAEGFPGSLEIICCHIIHREISNKYDIVILDTPPSSQSVSFLNTPEKLSAVLRHSIFRAMAQSKNRLLFKITKKLASMSSALLFSTVEKIVGSHFLSEVLDFALSIDALYEPLLERANFMQRLLRAPYSRYVLVLRATKSSVEDSRRLACWLKEQGLHVDQVLLNYLWPNYAKGQALNSLVLKYDAERRYQEALITQIRESFVKNKICLLYVQNPQKSGLELLRLMLKDYQDSLCVS